MERGKYGFMKQYLADKIRNVALAGHGGSGKTSLAEGLLYKTGASDRLGKTADGNTICDYDPEEIKRKVSVSSAVAPLEWRGTKVNLLDTPGLFDFAAGLYEGIRACESVIITISGKSGLAVGGEKAYALAHQLKKAKMFFITKLDSENADFYKALASLQEAYGVSVCPVVVPHVVNHKVECYVNLLDMKAYKYDAGGKISETAVPDIEHLDELKATITEAVAETDEALMEKYFAGEEFTREEIIKGVHDGTVSGTISPVLCGSTQTLAGVDMLLDAIVDFLPSAAARASEEAIGKDGQPVQIDCTQDAPFSSFVFKTIADPFVGKLSFFKVISGKLSTELTPINARTGQPERLGKIIFLKGKKQEEADYIGAGDIGAVTKLSEAVTGDSYCDPKRVVTFSKVEFPAPCLSMAVKPKVKGEEGKIAQGIARLIEEDPSIAFEQNAETRQQVLSGLGEQHLDVIISRLKAKFGVDVELIMPRVPYRETIRKKVRVQGRHKKQTGGHGQFGDVWIEFEPTDGDDFIFEEKVVGGAVPRGFFPAVEKGLLDCIKRGTMAGYPMVGLKATLVDGSYHPVDSSEMAFKTAASLAYRAGIPTASPALLEPIGTLKVLAPDANTGDIMGELNKRRGRVMGMNPAEGRLTQIDAEVPMSEMHDFSTLMRSITQGRGSFTLTFERYELLPQMLEADVIADAKVMNEEE